MSYQVWQRLGGVSPTRTEQNYTRHLLAISQSQARKKNIDGSKTGVLELENGH
jgi:hypothetical protein